MLAVRTAVSLGLSAGLSWLSVPGGIMAYDFSARILASKGCQGFPVIHLVRHTQVHWTMVTSLKLIARPFYYSDKRLHGSNLH
jgi:hypothetical protein